MFKEQCFLKGKLRCHDYCTFLKLKNCHFVTNVILNKRPVLTLKSSCIYICVCVCVLYIYIYIYTYEFTLIPSPDTQEIPYLMVIAVL